MNSSYISAWLFISAIGVLFALIPAWGLFCSRLYFTDNNERARMPKWLIKVMLFANDDVFPEDNKVKPLSSCFIRNMRTYDFIGCLILLLIGFSWLEYEMIIKGIIAGYYKDIVDIIFKELSFPVSMSLTFFLPTYFLDRYIKKLNQISSQ